MSGHKVKVPWQASLIQQARALKCDCPPWVVYGESWHDPHPLIVRYWGAWCVLYDGVASQMEAEEANPNLRLLRYAKEKRFISQRRG